MSIDQPALSHLPYFERLAALEESSAEFRALRAGLVTLRLVDAWMTEGRHVVSADAWGLRAVREAIAEMDPRATTRALLTSAVDAMEPGDPSERLALVLPRLVAYARALRFEGEWDLATDVYRTILAHAEPMRHADTVITADLQLAAGLRTMARWDEARDAYREAGELAMMTGDMLNVLKSRIGEANVHTDRGNLPEAERILDQAIVDAGALGMTEVRALALQDRAFTAHRRGDFDAAVAMQHQALQDVREGSIRDRLLADMAASFFEIGLRTAARDANLVLAATAVEQYTRWQATINLMELAGVDRFEPLFEQYRRELATAPLPPILSAWYFFYVGQGHRMFAHTDQARAAFERSVEIAQRNNLSQVLFQSEQALGELKQDLPVNVAIPAEGSPAVAEAAAGVRRMREVTGIRV